jgi:hypothetical protein
MFKSEKDFEKGVDTTIEVLKETYINNILYVQDRMKDKAPEAELKNIEEIILATERLIVYFMQSDEWVKDLHEKAKAGDNDGGTTIDGTATSGDDEEEVARIEEARNS